jgi:hypothetical protein
MLACLGFFVGGVGTLAAQSKTATYSGVVFSDFSGEPVASVAIAIPALRRSTSTDSAGHFALTEIRQGTYEIAVRRVGYEPVNRRVVLRAGDVIVDTIRLTRVQTLEAVSVSAGIIQSFEENRAVGLGKFLDRDELEKMKSRRLSDIIGTIGRSAVLNGRGNSAWLFSKRGATSLMPKTCGNRTNDKRADRGGLDQADLQMGAQPCLCYAQVYLDKAMVYANRGTAEPLFNLNSLNVDQVEAVEYYASPAETPLEYSTLNSQCGVLVIHTRRPR